MCGPIHAVRSSVLLEEEPQAERLLGCGPIGRTPGCYPGKCWFESSRPSHSLPPPARQRLRTPEERGRSEWVGGPAPLLVSVPNGHVRDQKRLIGVGINSLSRHPHKPVAKHVKQVSRKRAVRQPPYWSTGRVQLQRNRCRPALVGSEWCFRVLAAWLARGCFSCFAAI